MYSSFRLASKYLQYYFSALNGKGHGIHSPFVFDFITTVLNDKRHYPDYDRVEKLRQEMMADQTVLTVEDFGAGSSMSRSNQRTIASIAKNAAKPKKYSQLLYRIIKKYQPQTILELGTSLGITTSYLASGAPGSKIITMEGSGSIAAIARQNFSKLQLRSIELTEGDFNETLPAVIRQLASIDFAFIDGNHRQEPTERYFGQLLSKANASSILIFDDIHWSREMEQAWEKIRSHEAVRCSIDLFFIGIIFFREEFKEKQHFTIRF